MSHDADYGMPKPPKSTELSNFTLNRGGTLQDSVNVFLDDLAEHNLQTVVIIVGPVLGEEFFVLGHVDRKKLPEFFTELSGAVRRNNNETTVGRLFEKKKARA